MPYQVANINQTSNPNTALGITLPFNGANGLFSSTYTTQQQAISNLKNLLLTVKGERVQHPKFGTDLVRLLFEPNTDVIKQNVNEVITEPVSRWLPYINIIEIKTITAEEDPNLDHNISISITFNLVDNLLKEDDLTTITLNASNNQITISDSATNGN
jgi:phage baseplate assembly protein W